MIVLHHDVTSLAAAVAVLRLQRLADAGGQVAFQGIDVLGLDATLPVTLDQLEEIERWQERAEALGLSVHRPAARPPTFGAHLIAQLAISQDLGAAWREATLRAYWTDGAALGEQAVLVELARRVGLDADEVVAALTDPSARLALRQRMTADRGRGVGGVPVLEVDGTFVPADLPEADLRQLAGL